MKLHLIFLLCIVVTTMTPVTYLIFFTPFVDSLLQQRAQQVEPSLVPEKSGTQGNTKPWRIRNTSQPTQFWSGCGWTLTETQALRFTVEDKQQLVQLPPGGRWERVKTINNAE